MKKPKYLLTLNFEKYYNPHRLLSFEDIWLYLLVGGRGIGKTTGIMSICLDDFFKNGYEFVYTRRYKNEIKKSKHLLDKFLPNVVTRGLGDGCYEYCLKEIVDDKVQLKRIGFGLCLTAQQSVKSGIDFSKVRTLVYDECIIRRKSATRYLSNEVDDLLELLSTIFRDRMNYRVFLIGNNADIFNPYTEYFKIPKFDDKYVDRKRGIYCELCRNNPTFMEQAKKTPLYRLTDGTPYGEYHYNNAVLVDNVTRPIGVKPHNAILYLRFLYNNVTLNAYVCGRYTMYIEYKEKIIKDNITYIIRENDEENLLYIKDLKKSNPFKYITKAYYDNGMTFSDFKAIEIMNFIMEDLK